MPRKESTPQDVVFFIDNDIGSRFIAPALEAAGAKFEMLVGNFPHDVDDQVWIPEVAKKGWVILTRDCWTKSDPEALAYARAEARGFVMRALKLGAQREAEIIGALIPKLQKHAFKHQAAFFAKITREERIETYLTESDLQEIVRRFDQRGEKSAFG